MDSVRFQSLQLDGSLIILTTNNSVNSADVAVEYRHRIVVDTFRFLWSCWLSQANYIFDCLHIDSNFGKFQVHSGGIDDPGSQLS
jgi:hypothetical protein